MVIGPAPRPGPTPKPSPAPRPGPTLRPGPAPRPGPVHGNISGPVIFTGYTGPYYLRVKRARIICGLNGPVKF